MNRQTSNISHIVLFITIIGLSLLFYTILHEAGHAIMAILSGAGISEFVIFDLRPHVSYSGQVSGTLGRFVSLAGPAFPVLVNMILLALIPISRNFLLEAFKTCFTLITAFSLPGTIIATLIYAIGRTSDIDTVGFYSMNPGVSPFAMIFIWFSVFLLLLLLMIKRANYRIMPGFAGIPLRSGPYQGHMVRIVFMSLVLMTIIGIAGAWYFGKEKPVALFCIDLSTFSAGSVELFKFDVKQDSATFSFSIRGLEADEFELAVTTDTINKVLISGKGLTADIYDRSFVLKKGIHILKAYNKNSKGMLLVNQK
jgi:hypothetical protein